MLLTGPKQIFNPASGREHDCASHCGGAGVTPEDHRLPETFLPPIPPLISAIMHAGPGAAAAAVCFSLRSFPAAENPGSTRHGRGSALADPRQEGLFIFLIFLINFY